VLCSEVHTLWAWYPDRFRDYISVPKPKAMPRPLHTDCACFGNTPVELQIRTRRWTARPSSAWRRTGNKNKSYGLTVDRHALRALIQGNLEAFAELLQDGGDPSEFLEPTAKLRNVSQHVFPRFSPKGKLIILPSGRDAGWICLWPCTRL